jgi:hypothetical protein
MKQSCCQDFYEQNAVSLIAKSISVLEMRSGYGPHSTTSQAGHPDLKVVEIQIGYV